MESLTTLEYQTGTEQAVVAAAVVFRRPPWWKRLGDVSGAVVLLILASPLMLLIGLYIKCVSSGPILFCQERIGAGAKKFVIYKFRTMHVGQEPCHQSYVAGLVNSDQPASKPSYESRLIRGGKWLRQLSLDELPQLFNVLQGSMSLIGPRPDVLEMHQYEPWQLRRFEVLPGISGLWQVSGKNRLTFNEMVQLDIEYIDQFGFGNDVRIAYKTLGLILRQHNE